MSYIRVEYFKGVWRQNRYFWITFINVILSLSVGIFWLDRKKNGCRTESKIFWGEITEKQKFMKIFRTEEQRRRSNKEENIS